jgi:hypothetical protein
MPMPSGIRSAQATIALLEEVIVGPKGVSLFSLHRPELGNSLLLARKLDGAALNAQLNPFFLHRVLVRESKLNSGQGLASRGRG